MNHDMERPKVFALAQAAEIKRLEAELHKSELFVKAGGRVIENQAAEILRLRAALAENRAAENLRLREALAEALSLCDRIVDRMGPYDHYTPPSAEDIFNLRAIVETACYG